MLLGQQMTLNYIQVVPSLHSLEVEVDRKFLYMFSRSQIQKVIKSLYHKGLGEGIPSKKKKKRGEQGRREEKGEREKEERGKREN